MNKNMTKNTQKLALKTAYATIALILWCVLWETVGAPLKNGGYWFALKGLILLPLISKLRRGDRYTFQVMSLLILLYVMEGLLRTFSDTSPSRYFAAIELALATLIFVWVNQFAYRSRPPRAPTNKKSRQLSWWLYAAIGLILINLMLPNTSSEMVSATETGYLQIKSLLNYSALFLATPYLVFIGIYRYLSTRKNTTQQ